MYHFEVEMAGTNCRKGTEVTSTCDNAEPASRVSRPFELLVYILSVLQQLYGTQYESTQVIHDIRES